MPPATPGLGHMSMQEPCDTCTGVHTSCMSTPERVDMYNRTGVQRGHHEVSVSRCSSSVDEGPYAESATGDAATSHHPRAPVRHAGEHPPHPGAVREAAGVGPR